MAAVNPNESYAAWVDDLASRPRFGAGDRRGTANLIDDAARQRAADAIRTGRCVALARQLRISDDERPGEGWMTVDVSLRESNPAAAGRPPFVGGPVNSAGDVLHVAPHGVRQTHLDGINHVGRRGQWYGGFAVDDPDGPAVVDLVDAKLFTRGVVADIPSARGTDWVDVAAPVTGDDIDAALASGGVKFEPGDALLLYMGRDRFEAAGNHYQLMGAGPMPGAGAGVARWIAEHEVSLLCWDFLDAASASEPSMPIHLLIWAIGLLLVDNCNLGPVAAATRESGSIVGGLVVAPPPLPRATGCVVGPLFVQ
jgi:kynurenine formamidase